MTDIVPQTTGSGKWWAGFVAAFLATYVVDHLEKDYGINFQEFGMSASIFKSLIEGSFVSALVWLTPSHLVQSITDSILFIKAAVGQWKNALNKPD